uniref:Uncharacterized protein n=1 Tax=Magallana gigas TaxID=29159 RepID=K1PM47_MAGGI
MEWPKIIQAPGYNIYHTLREKRVIIQVDTSGVIYEGSNHSSKYTMLKVPLNLTVYSGENGKVHITWVSGFNGGLDQFFVISRKNGPQWDYVGNLTDPGNGSVMYLEAGTSTPGQNNCFLLESCTIFNCTAQYVELYANLKEKENQNCDAEVYTFVEKNFFSETDELKHDVIENNQGLIYIDVDFSRKSNNLDTNQKLVIHGQEDRTEYTFVDLSKRAPPMQETRDEAEMQEES